MCELTAVAAPSPDPLSLPLSLGMRHAGVVRMICRPNNLINVVVHPKKQIKKFSKTLANCECLKCCYRETLHARELYVVPALGLKLAQQLSLRVHFPGEGGGGSGRCH